MTLRTRLGWLFTLFLVMLLYTPINRTVKGGIELYTPLDSLIPFWPSWVVPYLLGLAWWAGCYVWAALKMDSDLYCALVASTLFTMLTAYAFFIFYPTYVNRPNVIGIGWQYDLVRTLYANDRTYNAFPSGHTYFTALILLFWWRWQPTMRWLWLIITILILLSTLFTHQHYLLDLVGGVVWAAIGYGFGLLLCKRLSHN